MFTGKLGTLISKPINFILGYGTITTLTLDLVNNLGVYASSFEKRIISSERLQIDDNLGNPSQIVFTVTAIPIRGILYLNNTPLAVNDTFTQEDIDNNLLKYRNSGTSLAPTDSFSFTAENSLNYTLDETTFDINVDLSLFKLKALSRLLKNKV